MVRLADLYTEKQRDIFCEQASKIGIYAAIRELGYPKTRTTALKWMNDAGVEDQTTYTPIEGEEATPYNKAQQLRALGLLLDQMIDLASNSSLDPDELARMASAVEKVVSTIRLIENKPTHISAQGLPPQTQELLDSLAGANQTAIAKARAPEVISQLMAQAPWSEPTSSKHPLPLEIETTSNAIK